MVWVFIAAAAVFITIGIAILRNPEGWSSAVRASQQRHLGPWARPDDQIGQPGLFGNDKQRTRVSSMRATGVAFIAISIASVLIAIFAH